jgi:large subunit ribosomal protein L18
MGILVRNKQKQKAFTRARRAHRVRARISGTAERPRLAVHRTLKHMRAQLIDDVAGKTLVSAGDHEIKGKTKGKTTVAKAVGALIAEKAKKAGITAVVFDRRAYRYHGRVAELATGAREGGLKF